MKIAKKQVAVLLALLLMFTGVLPVFSAAAGGSDENGPLPEEAVIAPIAPHEESNEVQGVPLPPMPEGYHFSGRFFDDCERGMLFYIETEPSELGLTVGYWVDAAGTPVDEERTSLPREGEAASGDGTELPSAYDARNDGLVTPPESQIGGTCWALTAAACIETGAIKKGLATNTGIDLSEYYLVWFSKNDYFSGVTDARNDGVTCEDAATNLLGEGGNVYNITDATRNFAGPALESRYPFTSTSSSALYNEMANTFTFADRFARDVCAVTGYKRVGLTNDAIKNAVLECGAVQISYYHDNAYYANAYNAGEPCAYYYPQSHQLNHAVAIIGWDDAFSKEHFNSYARPESDGAWLVKNTFGTGWGDGGFFWLSYEDKTIYEAYTYTVEPISDYQNVYFYDGYGSYGSEYASKGANVFVAQGNEYLTKVSTGSANAYQAGTPYKFSIYKDLPENVTDPTAGTLIYTQTGPTPNSEYIDVVGSVDLQAGDRFSVVFEDMRCVYREVSGSHWYHTTLSFTSQPGQSFYEKNGEWIDPSTENKNNVCIRAVTKSAAAGPYTVSFTCPNGSHTETVEAVGSTVTLPSTPGHTWVFTYNGVPFTGTGVYRDMTVLSHCYPDAGTPKEGYPCTTEYRCIYCGQEMKDAVTVHDFTVTPVTAAPDRPGYTKHTCNVCGYEKITDPVFYGENDAGGLIGENFVWQIHNGVLSVCGQGRLPDRTADAPSPWQAYEADITSLVVHEGITATGKSGFEGLTKMTQMSLPSSLKEINNSAFQYARSLVSFTAPENLERIEAYAFQYVDKLEEIHFNDKLTYLGGSSFSYAPVLQEMIIPASVTSKNYYVYRSCASARLVIEEGVTTLDYTVYSPGSTSDKLPEIVIPASVTSITSDFYYYTYCSKAYVVHPDNQYYSSENGVLYNKDKTTLVCVPSKLEDGTYFHVPATVTAIAPYAFSHCWYVQYIDMSDCAVETLPWAAIYNPIRTIYVNLPLALQTISDNALRACSTFLAAIYIPASVATVNNSYSASNTNITTYTDSADAAVVAAANASNVPCQVLEGHVHSYDTTLYTRQATCGKAGREIRSCVCGCFICNETPPTGSHRKTNPVVTAPSCTEQGYTTYTCSVCGNTFTDDYVAASGHTFEWVVDEPANCIENGLQHEECSVCGATRSENTVIYATGSHTPGTPVEETVTPASCGTAGRKKVTVKCTVCGNTISEEYADIPATGNHSWQWIVDEYENCGNNGKKHEECTVCGATRNENTVIPAAGSHTPGTPVEETVTPASCGTAGRKKVTVKCTVCGSTVSEEYADIPATGDHSWGWVTDTPATCVAAGVKHEECALCHAKRNEGTAIGATGNHTYTDQTVKDDALKAEATCRSAAVYWYSCSVCGRVEHNDAHTFTSGATAAHSYTAATVKTEAQKSAATCQSPAVYWYSCSVCGAVEKNNAHTFTSGNTAGHSWSWVTDTPATCGKTGVKHEECSVCHDKRNENSVIPATGDHSWGWVTDTPATCGTAGVKHEECASCHIRRNENTSIPATGNHNWNGGVVTSPATCTSEGVKLYTCNTCGKTYTEYTAKTAHTDGNGDGYCDTCGAELSAGRCKYCGEIHTGFFGKIVGFFHNILYFFKNLFR